MLVTHTPNWQDVALDERDYLEALTSLHPYSVSEGLRAFYRLYAGKFGKPRWGEKTPANLERLRAIAHILPEAHFIHIIRDGRDVALSLREMWFAPGRDLTTLARYWRDRILQARREAERNLRYLEIRYEDLIANPERTLRDVCAFVDLSFDTRMLRYHETARQRLDEVTTWVGPDGVRDGDEGAAPAQPAFHVAPANRRAVGPLAQGDNGRGAGRASRPRPGTCWRSLATNSRWRARRSPRVRRHPVILSTSVDGARWLTHL